MRRKMQKGCKCCHEKVQEDQQEKSTHNQFLSKNQWKHLENEDEGDVQEGAAEEEREVEENTQVRR